MNAGAAQARAETLLFLHADSELCSGPAMLETAFREFRRQAKRARRPRAGHFALRFLRTRPGRDALYSYMEAKTRSNRPGTINGDQGLMIERRTFDALGGFDESLPIFEDQRMSARIFCDGAWVLLPGELGTSARRFEREGHFQRFALMALMMAMHESGMPEFLSRARNVYAEQSDARKLDLSPFADLAREIFVAKLRGQTGLGAAQSLGRYLRSNGWQLGLMIDLFLGAEQGDWADRLGRLCSTPRLGTGTDALVGLIGAGLVLGVVPIAERIDRALSSQ